MSTAIGLIVSALGACFYGMDFCTLYTFISVALELYKYWNDHANDKTALQ